jgi:hypothetical protein
MADSPYAVTNPTLNRGGTAIEIHAADVVEIYTNPIFSFTRPKSTGKQEDGAYTARIINLLRIKQNMNVSGHVDSANVATIRDWFLKGDNVNYPLVLKWDWYDGTTVKKTFEGVMIDLKLRRKGSEEQDEWIIEFTFERGTSQ